jgi:catechol-2,3-dioxygenase
VAGGGCTGGGVEGYRAAVTSGLQLEVAHAVLYVHDVERMIDFYTNTLGFEVTDRGPLGPPDSGVEIVFLSQTARHHHQLAFVTGREKAERSNSVHHMAFRSAGTLDDLKALKATLEAEEDVAGIMPLTHGNAWSVYFRDPERNGVEVFIDTPWHVSQPQGEPLDLGKTNDEIVAATRARFEAEPGFGSIDEFYEARAEHLG